MADPYKQIKDNDSVEVIQKAREKANIDFGNRSPLGLSLASFVVGFISLPFWSKSQYEQGVEKAVTQTKDGNPNAMGFAGSVIAGAIAGAAIGAIIFAFASVSWTIGAAIGYGALFGALGVGGLTAGTFGQMAYYRNAGKGKGKICLYEERQVEANQKASGMEGRVIDMSPLQSSPQVTAEGRIAQILADREFGNHVSRAAKSQRESEGLSMVG